MASSGVSDLHLLALDHEADDAKDLLVARVIDLTTKKEISKKTLVEKAANFTVDPFTNNGRKTRVIEWGRLPLAREGIPFSDAKNKPRVLFDGKIYDAIDGKVLGQFDPGLGARISRAMASTLCLVDGAGVGMAKTRH